MVKPPKSCLDPTFKYTVSHQTDISKRIKAEQKRLKDIADQSESKASVTVMRRAK